MADDEIEYDYGDDNDDDDLVMKKQAIDDSSGTSQRRSRSPPNNTRTVECKQDPGKGLADNTRRHTDKFPKKASSRQYEHEDDRRHYDHHHPHNSSQPRFFVLKCEFYSVFAQSKRTRVWPARRVVGDRLDSLYKQGHRVGLFFTLEKARCFVGMAWMTGRVVDGGRFSEVPLKYLAFKDVNFDDFGRDISEDLFADPARATIRDGVELSGHCGRLIERAFMDPKYGVDIRGYYDDTDGGNAAATRHHHHHHHHDRYENSRRDRH